MAVAFQNRDIISITDFSRAEILQLCEAGKRMYELDKSGKRNSLRDALKYRTLSYMFYEPSTRTRTSFNTAMRELGGRYDGFSGTEGTSVMKNETVRDTVAMMGANHFDVIVMRHPLDGSLQWAADVASIPVINGGDGKNEHPTQALLDVLTLYVLNHGKLDGLRVGFGGDLSHGRTVRSLSLALSHFDGITIRWAAEDFLGMPEDLSRLLSARGVKAAREKSVREVMTNVDFYYMTRPQLERMPGVTQKEIMAMMQRYRIDMDKVQGFHARVLHPLPVNSEVAEIDYRVYFTPAQAFFAQSVKDARRSVTQTAAFAGPTALQRLENQQRKGPAKCTEHEKTVSCISWVRSVQSCADDATKPGRHKESVSIAFFLSLYAAMSLRPAQYQ
jgi:aspartate carbamoyltransferase catalytic subunit